ncbi:MAG TPA: hypothetical protein DCO77_12565 [Nitrospiraceae bacterium]|nr:hypothetical protein [Nitrospiraceae bacterium]
MFWMTPSVIATTLGTLVLALIYLYLYVRYRERYLRIWTVGWAFSVLRFSFQLLILFTGESSFLIIGNQVSSLVSGFMLLWGTYVFTGRRLSKWWGVGCAAGILWIISAVLFGATFTLLTLPTFIFLGAIYVWTGIVFLRLRDVGGFEKHVTGWAFIIWGVHKIDYPFLRPLNAIAPWGYLLSAILEITVAFGMVLVFFQKTQRTLSESEERYRNMFRNNHAVMLLIDPATSNIVDANPAACSFYGYTRAALTAKKISDINILSETQIAREMQRAKQEGRSHFYFDHRLADGTIRNVEVYSGPVRVEGKTLLYSIIHNITDRRDAEHSLRTTMSQFAALIENMHDGILFEDTSRNIALVNPALCSLFGIPPPSDDLIGRDCREAAQAASALFSAPKKFTERIEELIHQGEIVTDEKLFLADERVVERDYIPISLAGASLGHLWLYRDVTERRKLQDQLRHAQKMEAVGTLAGGIAHDFNNILTAIIGYGNIIKMRMEGNNPLISYVDQILSTSERAAVLSQSLLAFSRRQGVTLQPVNIHDLTQRVDKLLRRLIGEDIDLTCTNTDPKLYVMADSGHLEQVLMNLATNARDAMPDGGRLTIEVSRTVLDESYRKLHGYGRQGEYALISVTDTGVGMTETDRERIFEPFFTTKEVGKGTGLGLAIAYGIVKQHHGYISCYSEPGIGTTFKMYLPVTTTAQEQATTAEAPGPIGGTETILVAEDDAGVRKLTKVVLEEFGYTVIEAEDGEAALRKFDEHADRISFLLLDVIMPKKNGKEVFEKIRAIRPDIKALFTSGYTANIIHRKGILDEGLHFISKPIAPKVLLEKVRSILDR